MLEKITIKKNESKTKVLENVIKKEYEEIKEE